MISEKIIARGEVDIMIYKDGKEIGRIYENNLVVTLGKTNIAKLLGGDPGGKPITKIGVGESNVGPYVTDNALTNAFIKDVTSVSYPDAQSVLYNIDITDLDANGLTIREFGLLTADSVLCARKVRDTDIIKTNSIRLVGTWKITIN